MQKKATMLGCGRSLPYDLEDNGRSIRYNGANGIEYTSGGFGNGLAFNSTSYFNEIQISLIGNCDRRLCKLVDTVPTMNSSYNLQFSNTSQLKPDILCANNYNELSLYQRNCDLEGYINNYQAKDIDAKNQIRDFKDCLFKINQIKREKDVSYQKKGMLKKLISKYKSLQQEIDAIQPFSLGGK